MKKSIVLTTILILTINCILSQAINYHPKQLLIFKGKPLLISTYSGDSQYDVVMSYDVTNNVLETLNRIKVIYSTHCTPNNLFYFGSKDITNVGLYSNNVLIKTMWKTTNFPDEITNYGDTIIFSNYDEYKGKELWMSDGTTQGTKLLLDLNDGEYDSNPHSFYIYDKYLFFIANSPRGESNNLWLYNFESKESKLVSKYFREGNENDDSQRMRVINGNKLVFIGIKDVRDNNQCIWVYNIINATADRMIDFDFEQRDEIKMEGINNYVFFAAKDEQLGNELWVTDGTILGTRVLMDINPGYLPSYPNDFSVQNNNKVYFYADDGSHGREIWCVDSTLIPYLIADLEYGPESLNTETISLFSTDDGIAISCDGGTLYLYNGKKLNGICFGKVYLGRFQDIIECESVLYFHDGQSLWSSTGNRESTSVIKPTIR